MQAHKQTMQDENAIKLEAWDVNTVIDGSQRHQIIAFTRRKVPARTFFGSLHEQNAA